VVLLEVPTTLVAVLVIVLLIVIVIVVGCVPSVWTEPGTTCCDLLVPTCPLHHHRLW
jgi:hypothetical protein